MITGDMVRELEEWGGFTNQERHHILMGLHHGLGRLPPLPNEPGLPLNPAIATGGDVCSKGLFVAQDSQYGSPDTGMLSHLRKELPQLGNAIWKHSAFMGNLLHACTLDAQHLSLPAFNFLWIRLLGPSALPFLAPAWLAARYRGGDQDQRRADIEAMLAAELHGNYLECEAARYFPEPDGDVRIA